MHLKTVSVTSGVQEVYQVETVGGDFVEAEMEGRGL